MESFETSFTAAKQKKKKQKRVRNIIIICAVAIVAAVGTILVINLTNKDGETTSTLSYRVSSISSGEISSTISGSGTLSALETQSVTTTAQSTITAINFAPGDAVKAGDVVMTMTSEDIESDLSDLQDELSDTRTSLAGTTQLLSNRRITASKSGIVKDVQAETGSIVDDMDYLCLIATDGKMQLTIPLTDGMSQYDAVTVVVGDDEQSGYITEIGDDTATIVFTDNYYPIGTSATVLNEDGDTLGTGEMTVNEYVKVTAASGKIESVYATDNKKVSSGSTLFTLAKGAPTSTYTTLKETEADLLEQIADLEAKLTITAENDCTLTALSVAVGDTVSSGTSVCTLTGSDGFTISLSIDELDIATVALDQNATITLDAIDGEYSGKVTNISYSGSGSYVTSYTATITTDPIEGAYPGMSASAEIVTETSGESLIVSVSAVQYDGDSAYIYLAGDDAQLGTSLSESEIDLDSLTKVTVTTGMSDGSYIVITGEGLSSGDLIWVPDRTSTATYSEDDESTTTTFSFGDQSGMMGGDTSSFPQGDMSGGNMGGGGMGGGPNG